MNPVSFFPLAAALALTTIASAGDLPPTPAQTIQSLRAAVDAAETAYLDAGRKDENSDHTEELWKFYRHLSQTNLAQIYELAAREPASEPAFEAFEWIATNRFIQMPQFATNGWKSLEFLRDYAATNPGIATLCRKLGRRWDPDCQPALDLLQIAAAKNPNREVRAQATLALALLTKEKADNLVFFQTAPPGNARFEKLRASALANPGKENSAGLSQAAEKLFNTVLSDYADYPTLQPANTWQVKLTLGDEARAELYELEHLSAGSTAPEMAGAGIDGKHLALSDYRGKVVVVSFWASWCGPCMQLVPSEVRLAERMKCKPFALVGVNGDEARQDVSHAMLKNNMTWPSFFSTNGPDGPIPTAWNVSGWPTVFVLDANGVIRFKFIGYGGTNTENQLVEEVDQILSQYRPAGT